MEGLLGWELTGGGQSNFDKLPMGWNSAINNRKDSDSSEDVGRKFVNMLEKYEKIGEYRSNTLSDINAGLNTIATGINVITTILSLFGAQPVDRSVLNVEYSQTLRQIRLPKKINMVEKLQGVFKFQKENV